MADLLPLQDAAAEFKVNPATIFRYLRKGKLKRYRRAMDFRTYVDRAELRVLLEFKEESPRERVRRGLMDVDPQSYSREETIRRHERRAAMADREGERTYPMEAGVVAWPDERPGAPHHEIQRWTYDRDAKYPLTMYTAPNEVVGSPPTCRLSGDFRAFRVALEPGIELSDPRFVGKWETDDGKEARFAGATLILELPA